LRAALRFGHFCECSAFGQGDGEGVAGERGEQVDAVVDVVGGVAAAAECFGDAVALAFGRGVAGAPVAPAGEVGVFEHVVQDDAEAGAAEAWIVCVGGRRGVGFVGGVGFVAAAGGGLGGGARGVVAGVG